MPLPLPASSGDLLVDRRFGYAEALAGAGDPAAAADILADALTLAPDWTAGWMRLGEWQEAAGETEAAKAAFERALALDPADRLGAGLRRDLLRRVPVVETMPSAFVETLFDGYAAEFDTALVDRLGYRGPQVLAAALAGRRYAAALDLGCGTGLAGVALRGLCDRLEGWDISGGMLREAAAKGVYDRLERRDLSALAAPPKPAWDLVVAADVFNYLGALERITSWVAQALVPGGVFGFTVEAEAGEGFSLGEARRYRHSEPYLRELLAAAGFAAASVTPAVLRHDRDLPVPALLVRAEAPGGRPDREGEAMAAVAG